MSQSVIIDPDAGVVLQVLSEKVRVLATGMETEGAFEAFEVAGEEGGGAPPHRHAWGEVFFITEGEVEITVADKVTQAKPGAFVYAPPNTIHGFRLTTPKAKFFTLSTKPGAAAFFTELDREIGFPPKAMEDVLTIAERHKVVA
jgi:quercetin dioxygenase-like cupin family protein